MNPGLICSTCLSTDRRLIPLHKITHFIKEINFTELTTLDGAICWECRSNIMKYHRFRTRALLAQTELSLKVKFKKSKPLTSLVLKVNLPYDYQYTYSDPLTNCDSLPKIESIVTVKEEDENYDDNDNNEIETDEKLSELTNKTENVYVDTINSTKDKKNVKKAKIDEQVMAEKFIKVVFTEEEMLKSREDKRSHYNFKKIPFKCDTCVLGFTRKETYDKHMEKKHNESVGPYTCDICQVRFATDSGVSGHRWRHYSCYKCRLCKYSTTELWSALNHCKLKHERDRLDSIHCTQCEHVVKTAPELEEHMQSAHTLYCNECGVRFKGKHTLRRHKARIHGVSRPHTCEVCARALPSRARLEAHVARHGAAHARALAYCAPCRVQYKNIYVYRNHLRNSANHSERAYSCPECNKKFASKVYWTKHYNFYHLHKSQYNCDVCNKLFISEWRLTNHRQKHHGLTRPRDHTCTDCGKKFFTESILRNHKLTHSEQRSYMCEDCGDTFKQRPALYTHAKLVHADAKRK